MKSRLLLIIMLISTSALGQEQSSPILIDEIGNTSCEDLMARVDNFSIQLESHPAMIGVVLVSAQDSVTDDYPAHFIYRTIIGRHGLKHSMKIFRTNRPGPWQVQFWLAQKETDVNLTNSKLVTATPQTITASFHFGDMSGDPCTNHIGRGFAILLKSDPTYVGHIVVYNVPQKRRAEIAADWLKSMREDYGIQRKQLRVFFRRDKSEAFIVYNTKFWIVPMAAK